MYTIKPLDKIKKEINIPPDKSISHRAVMISSIAEGETSIEPFLMSDDTLATLDCIKKLGIKTTLKKDKLEVRGQGMFFPGKKEVNLFAKESGTTLRILSGILSAQRVTSYFGGASSLMKRPMSRITQPLRLMGADINGEERNNEEYPPLTIKPVNKLNGIKYKSPIASAQVKSAVLFASLYARGETRIYEPFLSRDHTERMLSLFKAPLRIKNNRINSSGVKKLISPENVFIPSDFSSAAFFITLGAVLKDSELFLKNISLNKTRCGFLKILKKMGAEFRILNKKNSYEPYGDILVKSSNLHSIEIEEQEIPSMIDEIPILCVAASFAKGITVVRGVRELKVKETDRINSLVSNLKKTGVKISSQKYLKEGKEDWLIKIEGTNKFRTAYFKSFSDHRTAMSLIIFALASGKTYSIDDIKCIDKSFPEFISVVEALYE